MISIIRFSLSFCLCKQKKHIENNKMINFYIPFLPDIIFSFFPTEYSCINLFNKVWFQLNQTNMVVLILHWFILPRCDFSVFIFTFGASAFLGRVPGQRVVCCHWPQRLATAENAFLALWLAETVTLPQLSVRTENQSDSDICSEPRGEPRRRFGVCPL